MNILYLDPVLGISGDMTISALLDAGCPFSVLMDLLSQLPVSAFHRGRKKAPGGGRRHAPVDGPERYPPVRHANEADDRGPEYARTRQDGRGGHVRRHHRRRRIKGARRARRRGALPRALPYRYDYRRALRGQGGRLLRYRHGVLRTRAGRQGLREDGPRRDCPTRRPQPPSSYLDQFKQGFPTLANSPEGRRLIAAQLALGNRIAYLKDETYKAAMDHYGSGADPVLIKKYATENYRRLKSQLEEQLKQTNVRARQMVEQESAKGARPSLDEIFR